MNLIDRAKAPTPKFFRIVRNIGLIVAAVGGALIASPVTVPAVIVTIGSYLTVIGGVLSAVSQVTVDDSSLEDR
ncbi:hypothetical protein [Sphingobacterium sp. BN32]|uniref:hypothetical protein n=1 Tax=Sphingobacterium sp. BN32 TaxID=3058432 RepID=UPI00265CC704|nr:hypothetical protein [Sphingobacterium sp. BN32]WKK60202.1 hypothetical protein QYC40_08130 [Sphingobacterium sp. BN32]